MLNDILILDQQWLPNQSDFPPISWHWYRAWPSSIMSGFHGTFATGVACQQGTLTPDTRFRPPLWDLLVLQLLRPDSSNLPCLYSTFHLEYPLVLSRFCFILQIRKNFCHTCSLCRVELVVQFPARGSTKVLLCLFLVCCGCDTSYIVSVHIQCQAYIYTLSLCRGHLWRVRLAKQKRQLLPGTWSQLWFAGVCECPSWCSFVGATVTVHQFFCILHWTWINNEYFCMWYDEINSYVKYYHHLRHSLYSNVIPVVNLIISALCVCGDIWYACT